jgi:UDP-GlcNAc3NAcA epimerase
VVSRALKAADGLVETMVHTGQYYDDGMSGIFFRELGLPEPAHHLGIGSATHGVQTGTMMAALEPVVMAERPGLMLVYGDTNSTLAGALVGAKLQVPVAHVEAGLRSFNRGMPEEVNRIVTDHVSSLLFAPSASAVSNLRSEGVNGKQVHLVGDVMFDAARMFGPDPEHRRQILAARRLQERNYVLSTIHRAENTDNEARLREVFAGLMAAASSIPVVIPLHPRARVALERAGLLDLVRSRLQCLDPVGYVEMLGLVAGARLVATDSGGLQKEAYYCGTPCVTIRTETEWVELVESGWNQ